MTSDLAQFLDENAECVAVEVTRAKGSVPRETGTWMLVGTAATFGTIGGGQLEYLAIDEARRILRRKASPSGASHLKDRELDIALGPELGQCCGGRVCISFTRVNSKTAGDLAKRARRDHDHWPEVFIFGAGHVGKALAAAMVLLPVKVTVVETRPDELEPLQAIETHSANLTLLPTPLPEESVRNARPGSAFVILTHDHALDYLITAAALERGDARYVGMIGSKTKRVKFERYFREEGGRAQKLDDLICPIGDAGLPDKRPAVIAATTASQVLAALLADGATVHATGTSAKMSHVSHSNKPIVQK